MISQAGELTGQAFTLDTLGMGPSLSGQILLFLTGLNISILRESLIMFTFLLALI